MRLRRGTKAPRKRGRIRKLRLLAVLTVLVLLAGMAFTFGLVRAVASEIPLLDPAAQRSQVDGVIYASNGRSVLTVLRGDESRVLLKDIDDVSPIMRQAIVSVEDRRFYEHNGVDTRGIARALWQDIRSQARRRGWLHDHAAVRQERLRPQPEDDRAEGPRGGPRLAARAAVAEGPDPARLPQHDLLRQRRLRDPAGRPHVLRQGRRPPDARRVRAARRACRPTPRCTTPPSIRARPSSDGATCSRRCSTRARSPPASSGTPRGRRCRRPPTCACPAPRGPASTSSTTSRIS